MSELISGREAFIAHMDGKEVEFKDTTNTWHKFHDGLTVETISRYQFRLKPRTITLNNIEVPSPFEPKEGDMVWRLNELSEKGYEARTTYDAEDFVPHIAYWRTEDEIKQVVSALRSVFEGGME